MTGALVLAAIVFVVLAVVIGPFALIWAINMLWDLSNPYNFDHWLAGFVIIMLLGASGSIKSKE